MKSNRHLLKFSSLLVLLLLLAACGSSEPTPTPNPTPTPVVPTPTPSPIVPPAPGGTAISGNVIAPSGGDVGGTEVGVCPVINNELACASGVSVIITQPGPSAPYNLEVQAGQPYIVYAYKDANGNGAQDDGDYLGSYPSVDAATPVTAPASSIDITMQTLGGGSTPTPDPGTPTPPPSGGSGISGTISAGAAGDVANTIIGACSDPGCANPAGAIQISQSGPSAAYSLDVPAGSYLVIAAQDANGDGVPDYGGIYESSQNQVPVTAPANGINIQLEPIANFGSANISGVDKLSFDKFDLSELQNLLE